MLFLLDLFTTARIIILDGIVGSRGSLYLVELGQSFPITIDHLYTTLNSSTEIILILKKFIQIGSSLAN